MKKTLFLILVSGLFITSCDKPNFEKKDKKEKFVKTTSPAIKKINLTEKELPDKKGKTNLTTSQLNENIVSNTLAFSNALDLDTLPEEGNVEYMKIKDAKRILENSKTLKIDFVENIANNCRDFDVINYFLTNLCEKILVGEIIVEFTMPDVNGLPPQLLKLLKENINCVNNNKYSSAAFILKLLGVEAQRNQKYEYSVAVLNRAVGFKNNEFLKSKQYDLLAIAYNCLHDFDNEAKSQYENYKYSYENRKKYPKEYFVPDAVQYIEALENAKRYDEAIKLAKKLIKEGYLEDQKDIFLDVIKSKDGSKFFRSIN